MHQSNSLGIFIFNRRRALNLSRADLADRLTTNGYECTESAINHWEKGRAQPPIENPVFASALASILELKPSDLVRATGVFEIPPDVEQSILARFSPATLQLLKQASPQDIKKVEAIIRTMLAESE